MRIEFDPEKASANIENHGVKFEEAVAVLLDEYALTHEDLHTVEEVRYITLGMGLNNRILIVVWTLRGENARIISAWKANSTQRRRYEQQF